MTVQMTNARRCDHLSLIPLPSPKCTRRFGSVNDRLRRRQNFWNQDYAGRLPEHPLDYSQPGDW